MPCDANHIEFAHRCTVRPMSGSTDTMSATIGMPMREIQPQTFGKEEQLLTLIVKHCTFFIFLLDTHL